MNTPSVRPREHTTDQPSAATDLVATTEPVIMEVAAGARNLERERELRRLLNRFSLLTFDSPTDFDAAVGVLHALDDE